MKKQHFTLIELLTAMAIVMILAGITIGGISYASARADQAKTLATMAEFETALEDYKNDYGAYPVFSGKVNLSDSVWDKFTNKNDDNKKKKPYSENYASGLLEDAYGKPFYYEYPNLVNKRNLTKYALWSMGKDNKHGSTSDKDEDKDKAGEEGSDDICNWKQN